MEILSRKVIYSPKITTRNKHIKNSAFCFAIYLKFYIVELKKNCFRQFHYHSLSKSLSYDRFHRQFYILLVKTTV